MAVKEGGASDLCSCPVHFAKEWEEGGCWLRVEAEEGGGEGGRGERGGRRKKENGMRERGTRKEGGEVNVRRWRRRRQEREEIELGSIEREVGGMMGEERD